MEDGGGDDGNVVDGDVVDGACHWLIDCLADILRNGLNVPLLIAIVPEVLCL